ncbi:MULTISPECIES: NADP-dependent oxidoreductase [Streptomyces]|uniref:NADP-dependent oxidoreductase n=1 Tax=Streptomyces TaxID=1883 RepID=UPI0006FBD1F9|nr:MULTISPECIES: NADP-dependent oxidoreductase [unclassified Streptomyces]KQZ12137.1 NADPH:quinone oxidoreductase [Streptomyces sp. Root55]MDX3066314.1 NADP-dependent oxidoreductase [Streptomyces sp. ND04-05B]RPK86105.1 Phenolphthiocerol synthesis polyketide synthase type I Pks15/1 [Streptomyces sp. ADI97-07]
MKAFVLERYGSPLREVEMPVPVPAPHEVLIRMVASGVNHADERVRSGEFKAIFPFRLPKVMGGELSGEVVEAGSAVRDVAVGDHVYGYVDLAATGTFSEFVAVDAATMAPVPRSVSLVEAAGLPVVALTAWQALVEMGKVKKGQTVLIHGGTGGVGSAAIQLARHLGCTVATTVSTANIAAAQELGADIVIDYRRDDLAQSLAGTPVDLVLDTQGGATLKASLGVLRPGGTVIGITGPPDPAFARRVGVNPVVRLAIRALSARTRRRARALKVTYRFLFITPDSAALRQVAGLVDDGVLRPVIDRVLPFGQTPRALDEALAGGTRGKVLVTTDPTAVTNRG